MDVGGRGALGSGALAVMLTVSGAPPRVLIAQAFRPMQIAFRREALDLAEARMGADVWEKPR